MRIFGPHPQDGSAAELRWPSAAATPAKSLATRVLAVKLSHGLACGVTAMREIKSVWVEVRAPSGLGDCGAAEEGWYYVDGDDVLTMTDEDGRVTGASERLTAGMNERAVAGAMKRRAWLAEQGASERFSRPAGVASPLLGRRSRGSLPGYLCRR